MKGAGYFQKSPFSPDLMPFLLRTLGVSQRIKARLSSVSQGLPRICPQPLRLYVPSVLCSSSLPGQHGRVEDGPEGQRAGGGVRRPGFWIGLHLSLAEAIPFCLSSHWSGQVS